MNIINEGVNYNLLIKYMIIDWSDIIEKIIRFFSRCQCYSVEPFEDIEFYTCSSDSLEYSD
tara:strand:+ start:1232 stop:1414 length:183 start_codon:yes stop_codon:yes gene_type:complete